MNRYEKLEWLEQVCSEKFMKEEFVLEMVRWMGENEFEEFYDHLCRNWEIAKGPKELDELMGIGEDEEELAFTIGRR
jgi:hypothetical protein